MKEQTAFYSVVIVFSRDKKKVLLGKRREDGLWTSPAGGGIVGESPEDAAVRELFEEANIRCDKSQLKSMPSMMAGNGKPIFLYALHLKKEQNIHPKNDPDNEVPSWKWFDLDELPTLERNRKESIVSAKMNVKELLKSIVSTDMFTGVDLNTQDYSQDDMASRDTYWHDAITALVEGMELNEPKSTELENNKAINIHKIGEGLYSGNIKDSESGDKLINFNELSIASLVQMLKAKEFIGQEEAYKKDSPIVDKLDEISEKLESPPEGDSDVKVEAPGIESLQDLISTLRNVHIEGDLNITIKKSLKGLIEELKKAKGGPARGKRGFPVGTKRTYSNGVTVVKIANGKWVNVGGKHHGKEYGKHKEEAKYKEHADGHLELTKEQKIEANKKRIAELQNKLAESERVKREETRKRAEAEAKTAEEGKRRAEEEAKRVESEASASGEKSPKGQADGSGEGPVGGAVPKDGQSDISGEDEAVESPREEAPTLAEQSSDYENARKSKVSNLGEDLLDSARHKVAWRTAAEAEATGNARKVVKRNKMIKDNPIQLAGASDPIKSAFLYQVMQSFPAEPDYKMLESSEYQKLANDPESATSANRRRFGHLEFPIKNEEQARAEYIESYNKIKNFAEELAVNPEVNMNSAHTKMHTFVDDMRRELNGVTGSEYSEKKTKYSLTGQQLHKLLNKDIGYNGRGSKAMHKVAKVMHEAGITKDNIIDRHKEIIQQISEGAAKGKTLQAAFKVKIGTKRKGKDYEIKGPAQFYVTDKANRKGPKTKVSNMADAQKALTPEGEFKMRGIQYGNSVTDSERQHHTTKLAESLQDLTDILGLPPEMASYNGRLGMAIGARGHGTAMAHYESGTKVINLTRKNGVGTLAHEWGHMMDNVLAEVNGGNSSFLSSAYTERDSDGKAQKAMHSFKKSEAWKQFKAEVRETSREMVKDNLMSHKKLNYWNSDLECFARAFEAHVQHKLESAERSNTYLSAAPKDGKLWPDTELRKKLAPHFDKLLEDIKASGDLKKALDLIGLISTLKQIKTQ